MGIRVEMEGGVEGGNEAVGGGDEGGDGGWG